MKNKLRWLILLTPFLLFAAVTLLGRERTPINTPKLQAILQRADYANILDSGGDAVGTLEEQTIYRGKNVRTFAARFRLSDVMPDENVDSDLGNAYNCWFMINKSDSIVQVAFIRVMFNRQDKKYYAQVQAPTMKGYFLLEDSSARELNEIFAALDARVSKLAKR